MGRKILAAVEQHGVGSAASACGGDSRNLGFTVGLDLPAAPTSGFNLNYTDGPVQQDNLDAIKPTTYENCSDVGSKYPKPMFGGIHKQSKIATTTVTCNEPTSTVTHVESDEEDIPSFGSVVSETKSAVEDIGSVDVDGNIDTTSSG